MTTVRKIDGTIAALHRRQPVPLVPGPYASEQARRAFDPARSGEAIDVPEGALAKWSVDREIDRRLRALVVEATASTCPA